MYFEYRSISDLNNTIIRNLSVFPHDIDLIVGIPRSGMLPANLIALYLNKPYTDIDSFIEGRIYSIGERGNYIDKNNFNNILIIDDSVNSGNALYKVRKKIECISEKYNIKWGVIYATSRSVKWIDYYCEIIDYARLFQWNLLHHSVISNACIDIDGVLCVDPLVDDDDGPIYINYITNARPLYLPTVEIHTLVTCRLEKYRDITEDWLRKWNICYKNLIMLNMKNKEERMKWGKHGIYKGEIYKDTNCVLFIESSLKEALEINKISGKSVFCIETFSMIYSNVAYEKIKYRTKESIKMIIKKIIHQYTPQYYDKIKRYYNYLKDKF
jgi:uncharacterized HAD superfamily protein/hypoxanthine phosphoribosyltransferase